VEKGKLTLPVIHFLRTAPPEHRDLLRSLMTSNDADKPERIRNLILPSGSMEYARASARNYAGRAREALDALPDTDARRVLEMMAEFVVSRPL
jgi:geranylgeranyl pyrophosphate synthase